MDAKQNLQYGYAYYNGKGVPLDKKKAFDFFVQAAKLGSTEAYYVLGVIYSSGSVVPKDLAKAAVFFQKAFDGGYVKAAAQLGDFYYNGRGVPANRDKAFKYYNAGAENGDPGCLFNAGYIALNFYKKYSYAYKCFELSAQKGNEVAVCYYNMGVCIQHTKGAKASIPYYKQAADMGFAQAMDQYGLLIANEFGQRTEAIWWIEQAVNLGYAPAKNHLKMVKISNGNGIISSLLGL